MLHSDKVLRDYDLLVVLKCVLQRSCFGFKYIYLIPETDEGDQSDEKLQEFQQNFKKKSSIICLIKSPNEILHNLPDVLNTSDVLNRK